MSGFTPVKKSNISDEITTQILKLVFSGTFRPGDRLPPERELAIRFDTNRNTLREAIRNLETLNVVAARQGDGLRVLDFQETGEINLLPHFLQFSDEFEAQVAVIADMLQLRRMLLAEVAGLLSSRSTPPELEKLKALVSSQRKNRGDTRMMMTTDLEISQTMVQASGSLAFRWIFNTTAKLYREIAVNAPLLWVFAQDYEDNLLAVLEAAISGDAQEARVLMLRHLEKSDQLILDALEAIGADKV